MSRQKFEDIQSVINSSGFKNIDVDETDLLIDKELEDITVFDMILYQLVDISDKLDELINKE